MFSQWRSKRHFPMDSASSAPSNAIPKSSFSDNDSLIQTASIKSAQILPPKAVGVKAFGKASISKAARFRPGSSREGSSGSRSPMSFAAGPRSNSRGAASFEFGGGVVPDSAPPTVGLSEDSPASPYFVHSVAASSRPSGSVSPSTALPSTAKQGEKHGRIDSVGSLGSFEDFRSLIAFSSPTYHLEERDDSPSLTVSTKLSTPEIIASASTSSQVSSTSNKKVFGPAIPTRRPSSSLPITNPNKANAEQRDKSVAASHDIPPASASRRRSGSASSFPETVSAPSSSVIDSKEFESPHQSGDESESSRPTLGTLVKSGSNNLTFRSERGFGLGILSEAGESSVDVDTQDLKQERVHLADNAGHERLTLGHTKSSSEASTHSSSESWTRASYLRELSRHLSEFDQGQDEGKDGSLAFSKTSRMQISDSGHSINTAETSTDIHESDQLCTIKERTESPESMSRRHASVGSSNGRFAARPSSDARTARTSASSGLTSDLDGASPVIRMSRIDEQAGLSSMDHASRSSSLMQGFEPLTAFNGLGSPTFGIRQRTASQNSLSKDLLPALELAVPHPVRAVHTRTESGASSHSKKVSGDKISLRSRKDSSSIRRSSSTRTLSEVWTTPLPSAPFAQSTSTPIIVSTAGPTDGTLSMPNTPNLTYEAALAKAVGKQRKARPAALTLTTSNTNVASGPKSSSILSPGAIIVRGLPSPSRSRAPPPSAPPPMEPLPPVPSTPSSVPKSPRVIQRKSTWTGEVSTLVEVLPSRRPSMPSLDVSDQSDMPHPLMKPRVRTTSAPSVKASPDSVRTFNDLDENAANLVQNTNRKSLVAAGEAGDFLRSVQEALDARGERASRASSVERKQSQSPHAKRTSAAASSVISGRVSTLSASDSTEEVASSDPRVAVARTLTRVPSTLLKMTSVKDLETSAQSTSGVKGSVIVPGTHNTASYVAADLKEITDSSAQREPLHSGSETASSKDVAQQGDDKQLALLPSTGSQTVPKESAVSPMRTHFIDTLAATKAPTNHRAHSPTKSSAATPPPSAWSSKIATLTSQSKTESVINESGVTKAATESGHGRRVESRQGAGSALSRRTSQSSVGDRRLEVLQDKEYLSKPLDDKIRLEVLRRAEGRFTGAFGEVAQAFRQLQMEKLLLEKIVREKTPLNGVGHNNESLSEYLSSMNGKLEQSATEIRKLLDLLEQQREVMDQMLATHQLEKETYQEDIERLQDDLDRAYSEIDQRQAATLRLNAEVEEAHKETVLAKAESLKLRSILEDESRKREKVVLLLRQAKQKLHGVEQEHAEMQERAKSEEDRHTQEVEELQSVSSRPSPSTYARDTFARPAVSGLVSGSETELERLQRLLEDRDNEIAALRMSHADAVIDAADDGASVSDFHHHGATSMLDVASAGDGDGDPATLTHEVENLRNQIKEQKAREAQIRTAYKLLRAELRKATTDRRRSSVPSVVPTVGALGASSTPRASIVGNSLSTPTTEDSTPVKLKRLSLPLVAKSAGVAPQQQQTTAVSSTTFSFNNGGGILPVSRSPSNHPPSSYRPLSSQTTATSTTPSTPLTPDNSYTSFPPSSIKTGRRRSSMIRSYSSTSSSSGSA